MSEALYKRIPDHEYLLCLEKMPVCCVDVVVQHKGKFLMVYRKEGNMWWVPGGRVCKDESFWDTAYRKVYEEVGLKVKVIKKLGSYEWLPSVEGKVSGDLYSQLDSGMHAVTTSFAAEVIDDPIEIQLDNTSAQYKWFDYIDDNWHKTLKDILCDCEIWNVKA